MARIYDNQKTAKDEWNKLKGAGFKKKLEYLAQYYWMYAAAFAVLTIFLVTFVPACIDNRVPNVISGEYMSSSAPEEENSETLRLYLCEKLGLNEEDYHISLTSRAIDTTDVSQLYTLSELVMARIMAQDIDYYCGSQDFLDSYMSSDDEGSCCFMDLTELLPEEVLSALESQGRLLYYTMDDGSTYPYLIDPSDSALSEMLGIEDTGYLGIVVNTLNRDAAAELCRLIAE